MEIRSLSPSDDRSAFESGDELLDRFFRQYAGQNQFRHYLGVTYVAIEARRILGFVTVAPGQLEIDALPAAARKKIPRHPLPVLRLARLAVERAVQHQGLGRTLLRFTLGLATKMAADYGCAGVVIDAKPNALAFYEKYGFVAFDALEGRSEARPRTTTMFLAMRAITAADSPKR
ncbi:MAG TPA: GNAT family N-acetyltransferase [Polyangiaceae bacterium]|jgi:GNAT superfamily N-acetyltransferase|nr:GNAT family N-acetyltransferase [Polyangiaceae bacterium]